MANCILLGGGGAGTLSTDVTASKANVLAGTRTITSDSNNEVVEGTMPNRGAVNQSLGINGTYTIPAGYHNGSGKVTQSIPIQNGVTITPNGSTQIIASGKYLNGNITVPGFALPDASLIKKGVTITIYGRSVTGTWEGYVATANQPFNRGTWGSGWSIVGQKPRENNYGNAVTITYPGSSIHLVPSNYESQGVRGGAFVYLHPLSMNGISTINISVSGNIGTYNAPYTNSVILGIWNSVSNAQFRLDGATVFNYSKQTISSSAETTISIDVSSVTTDQYIAFGAYGMNASSSYLDITRIWFT